MAGALYIHGANCRSQMVCKDTVRTIGAQRPYRVKFHTMATQANSNHSGISAASRPPSAHEPRMIEWKVVVGR